jgi:hypothetical protein
VAQPVYAQLAVLGRYALRVATVDGDEFGEVDLAAGEAFGKLQAQARRRGFGFRLVIGHAEAVLGTQLVVAFAHGAVVGEREASLHGVDGRAPVGAALQRVAEDGEGARLLRITLAALVTQVCSAGGVHRQVVALAILVRVGGDGEQRACQSDPGVGVVFIGDDGAGEVARCGARVGVQRALAVAAQIGGATVGSFPVRLEVGLVADRVVLDALMREGMHRFGCGLLRHGGRQREQKQQSNE